MDEALTTHLNDATDGQYAQFGKGADNATSFELKGYVGMRYRSVNYAV